MEEEKQAVNSNKDKSNKEEKKDENINKSNNNKVEVSEKIRKILRESKSLDFPTDKLE